MKNYDLFLFDLDDTLLDFKASERLSFFSSLKTLGIDESLLNKLFEQYQVENQLLWKLFEQGKTTKEHLKVERFRKIFNAHKIDINPEHASSEYLDTLPQTVVLMDQAVEICDYLSKKGEIGIITNGINFVQTQRIKNSALAPYISFTSVSEDCGHAKPDVRFFEYSSKMAKNFSKESSIVIGDRLDADILGARNFGVDSCWFNPNIVPTNQEIRPQYEIKHLSELKKLL
jgi:2-haloacid dehalogenase